MQNIVDKTSNYKAGETEFKNFMRQQEGIKIIDDVSDNPLYWKKDIDFLITTKSDFNYSVEVKWDTRINRTGNLFIETLSDIDKNKIGWFEFCEADYLAYGDSKNNLFYFIDFKELKKLINQDRGQFKTAKAADYNFYKEIKKYSKGLLISLSFLRSNNLIKKIIYL